MTCAAILSVMLLTDPNELIDAARAAAISEDADRVETGGAQKSEPPKSARITSRTSDFDRQEGVVLFEGDVVVRYSDDSVMCADKLYMFLAGSNELARVVAIGGVSITNGTRVGTCAMATYRRRKSEIEMFGDGATVLAHLAERGEEASELKGSRIKFWLDSEQVEVDDSSISVENPAAMRPKAGATARPQKKGEGGL